MKRKSLLALPFMLFGVLCSVSCGGTEDPTTPATDEGGGDDEITEDPLAGLGNIEIRFDSQWGGTFQTTFNYWADEFHKLHPNVTVNVNKISGDYTSVYKQEMADINAGYGDWGDIVSCYPDHVVDYIGAQRCVNLMDFIDNENPNIALGQNTRKDLTGAAKAYFNIEYPKKGMYCAPFSVSTEFMLYNKDILEWTIPGVNGGKRITESYLNNMTWEEFYGNFCPKFLSYNASKPDSEKLLRTDDGAYAVLGYDDDANAFITLMKQYGYKFTNIDEDRNASIEFNTPEARSLALSWNEYRNNNYVITEGSNNNSKPTALLAQKKVLFAVGSTGGITYQQSSLDQGGLDVKVGCALVPHAQNKMPALVLQGGSLCILSHPSETDDANRQLAAWMFYKFITNKANSITWASNTGYAPIRKSVYKTSDWLEIIDTNDTTGSPKEGIELLTALSLKYVQSNSDFMFLTDVFQGSRVAREQVDGMFAEILDADAGVCTSDFVAGKFNTAYNNIIKEM